MADLFDPMATEGAGRIARAPIDSSAVVPRRLSARLLALLLAGALLFALPPVSALAAGAASGLMARRISI